MYVVTQNIMPKYSVINININTKISSFKLYDICSKVR